MLKSNYDKDIKTVYCAERKLLAQYNRLMAKYHKNEIIFKETVHNANLKFLNPCILKALGISPNSIGNNYYYYTWNAIGTDRDNINENIRISQHDHQTTYTMVHFVNESFFFTLMFCCEQNLKYQLGTRPYLINLELRHCHRTYKQRQQAKIKHMKKWLDQGRKDTEDTKKKTIPISDDDLPF